MISFKKILKVSSIMFLLCGCELIGLSTNNKNSNSNNDILSSSSSTNYSTTISSNSEINNSSSSSEIGNNSTSSSSLINSSTSSSLISNDNEEDIEYNTFFDLNTRVEIKIKMTKQELIKLNQDYHQYSYNGGKSPLSRSADVEIAFDDKIYTYTQVGIKMKGNTSRTSFLNENNEINNLIHYKLDFSDTFNDTYYDGSTYELTQEKSERKARRFLGMEKLDLKWNRNYDATHIKQVYAYQMFSAFGVMGLKMNIGKVSLQIDNDTPKSLGIFEIAEVIDEAFLERRLPESELGGDLYKACYTSMGKADLTINNLDYTIGVEDEETSYFPMYDLKTNKKTSNHSSLRNLITYLNSNSVTKEGLAQYVDMDNFLMEEAVAYVLGNPDDLRNNYNNYYIYFGASSNKAYFIPYDWDRCLGITKDWNPTGNALTTTKHNSNWAQGANCDQSNPLVRYTLGREGMVIKDYNDQYTNNIKAIYESKWTNLDYFNSLFSIAKNHYSSECYPEFSNISGKGISFDNSGNNDSNMSFNNYMTAKRNYFYSLIQETDPGYASF